MFPFALLAIGIVLIFGISSSKSSTTKSSVPGTLNTPISGTKRILLIGDSLGVGLKSGLFALANSQNIPFSSDTRNSTHISEWARQNIAGVGYGWLAAALEKSKANIVFVSLGTNDTKVSGNTAEILLPNILKLVSICNSFGARVFWLLPPNMPWDTSELKKALISANVSTILAPENLERASDKVHSTPAGYNAWAGSIWTSLTG